MKNTFLRLLLLACALLPYLVQAQNIQVSPTGDACPNNNYTYTYTGSALGCSWVVKGAYTLVSGGQANSTSITVNWKDVPTDATNNPTSVGLSCNTGGPPALSVFVSSISNVTPGPLTINGTQVNSGYPLPFGDVTTLALSVPLVAVPNTTNNQFSALTYDWVIPNGWKYNDGTNAVSDGSTAHRVGYSSNSGKAGNQISVTSAAGTGGTIRVQAINNNCVGASAGPVNSVSQFLYANIVRTTPQLTIISDKSPTGGNFTLICGDQSDYHFRSTSDPLPAGGSFSNYAFSFQSNGVITPMGSVAGPTPATNFTGATGTALVGLRASYSRNGASTTVSAPGITVQVVAPPQPVITSSVASPGPGLYPLLCGPSARVTLSTNVAGATSYTWKATGGLGLNGPGVATLTTSSSSVTIFPGSDAGGEGVVTVSANIANCANCASPASADYGIAYGGAYQDGSVVMHAASFDYEKNCPYGCAGICPGSRVIMQVRNAPHTTVLQAT
ncbi:hypothetical protein [Hymenobacter psoromatis]|uniref:hypothetical protein n=1 Tax=Hymenobacter psoromatis TaxID=1484116 RepID=UPI001CBD6C48|nr:hypothetical protein [Hymenobacter psoromatis]